MSRVRTFQLALQVLRDGGIVALPTDTVFGLCAVAGDDAAVRRLYEVKRRDASQPLPLFVESIDQAALVCRVNLAAEALAGRFWPGALTMVLRRRPGYRTLAAGGGETLGVRAPADVMLRELAAELGPITGTSANLSGQPECRTADEVRAQLGDDVDLVVDAPVAGDAPPSTVVDCVDPARVRVLRQGAVEKTAIADALNGVATVD